MIDEEYHDLLKSLDEAEYECPLDFDYGMAHRRFVLFIEDLERELQHIIISYTGDQIQDAKFHSSFVVPENLHKENQKLDKDYFGNAATIIFSNFGNMVTSTNQENKKQKN